MNIYLIGTIHNTDKNIIGYRIIDYDTGKTMDVPTDNMLSVLSNKQVEVKGISIENSKFIGTNGSLDRYPKILNNKLFGKSSLVIINQIVNENGTLGYTVCDWKGESKRASLKDVIQYASTNGIANGALKSLNGKEFISPIQGEYPKIVIETPVAKVAKETVSISTQVKEVDTKQESKELEVKEEKLVEEIKVEPIVPNIEELEKAIWDYRDFENYLIANNIEYETSQDGLPIVTGRGLKVLKYPNIRERDVIYDIEHETIDLQEIIIPNTVTYISTQLFPKLSFCKKIYIQDGARELSVYTSSSKHYNCVEDIRVPDSMEKFNGFNYLNNLKKIDLSNTNLKELYNLFGYCKNLNDIKLPKSIVTISSCFSYTDIEEVVIPEGVRDISNSFNGCKRLKKLVLPKSLVRIADSFNECIIDEVDISNCSNLKELERVFSDCIFIEKVSLPEQLEVIGRRCFSDCLRLENIELSDNIREIEDAAFSDTRIKSITLGSKFEKLGNCLNKNIKITLNKNLTTIPIYAFLKYREIGSIDIQGSIEEVSLGAFNGTLLKEIELPISVEKISAEAFKDCVRLANINLQDLTNLEEIGPSAFYKTGITKAIFNESLVSIGDSAFESSKLKYVLIPKSVRYIGKKAFADILGLVAYVYRASYAEKYFKKNNISYVTINDIEEFYEYTHENRELAENKEKKLKLLVSQDKNHHVLLSEPYKNKADLLYSLYTTVSQIATENNNDRLKTDKFFDVNISAIPYMSNIISSERNKRVDTDNFDSYSADKLSPTFITLCNMLTHFTQRNTAPFVTNCIEYYKENAGNENIEIAPVYVDSCSSIISIIVRNERQYIQGMGILVEINGTIVYTTAIDRVDNSSIDGIFLSSHEISTVNSPYKYITPGDSIDYTFSNNDTQMFGVKLPKYIANATKVSFLGGMIVMAKDKQTGRYILMCKDNNNLVLMQASKKEYIEHLRYSTGNEYSLYRLPSSVIKGVCALDTVPSDWADMLENIIVTRKSNRLFSYRALGDKYTEKLASLDNAYDYSPCYEWELGKTLRETGMMSITDLNKDSLGFMLDSCYFVKTRKKVTTLESYSIEEHYTLKDGNEVTVYRLESSQQYYRMVGYHSRYVTAINIDSSSGFVTTYSSNDKLSNILLELRVMADGDNDTDKAAIDNNLIDKEYYMNNYIVLNTSPSYKIQDNVNRLWLDLAINKNNGSVCLIGKEKVTNNICKLLVFKDLKRALKYTTFMCKSRDNISEVTDKLLYNGMLESTRIFNTSAHIKLNSLSLIREDIMAGLPEGHYTRSEDIELFDSVVKQRA